ncbi:MAG: hypothetical protein D6763_01495 [Alphaproteobacteria bacterium]|nr:MAG: hypothetical protein D6763_01495 [Alphaproteobacteria bacterium]
MAQEQPNKEQARREGELAEFFANRPVVDDRGLDRSVRFSKVLLPLSALALLALIIAWPFLSGQEASVTLSYRELEKSGDEIRMVEPRYLGTDARDRRFAIAADHAVQQGINANAVRLDGVRASLRLDSGDDVTAAAARGIYRPEEERLILDHGIRLRAGGGYSFEGERLTLDLDRGAMQGDGGVRGAAPFGSFAADRFSADVSGSTVVLEGKVQVRLDPGYRSFEDEEKTE